MPAIEENNLLDTIPDANESEQKLIDILKRFLALQYWQFSWFKDYELWEQKNDEDGRVVQNRALEIIAHFDRVAQGYHKGSAIIANHMFRILCALLWRDVLDYGHLHRLNLSDQPDILVKALKLI